MIPLPTGARVFIATGCTDMRKGFDGLALAVQERLKIDPHAEQVLRRTLWVPRSLGEFLG